MTEKGDYKNFAEPIKKRNYDVPIYRIIPIDYILKIIEKKELTLSQTILWEDVYENFLSKTKFYIRNNMTSIGYSLSIYGQCWSLKKESDALWRIYSQNKHSVRIKTTINKLYNVSFNEKNYEKFSTHTRNIGQVEYFSKSQIINWIKERKAKNIFLNIFDEVDSLFIKRKEFKHESEVRLIIYKVLKEEDIVYQNQKRFIKLNINPNEIIEEITFDPRLDDDTFFTYKNAIKKMGYGNIINKSNLYKFDTIIIK